MSSNVRSRARKRSLATSSNRPVAMATIWQPSNPASTATTKGSTTWNTKCAVCALICTVCGVICRRLSARWYAMSSATATKSVDVHTEKMVTRHILEQTRRNGDDLAAVKSRLDRHDQRFDNLEHEVRGLRTDLHGLRSDLPTIVGEVVRDVLRDRDKKR